MNRFIQSNKIGITSTQFNMNTTKNPDSKLYNYCNGFELFSQHLKINFDLLVISDTTQGITAIELIKLIRSNDKLVPIVYINNTNDNPIQLKTIIKYNINRIIQDKSNTSTTKKYIYLKDDYLWDNLAHKLYKKNFSINLSNIESRLFKFLIKNHNKTLSIKKLFTIVFQDKPFQLNEILSVMTKLQKKVSSNIISGTNNGYTIMI